MNILGISAFYHDSAACLVRDGEIIAAAQEGRFTRKKHDQRFPSHAISYCLREGGIKLSELNYIALYDKPLLKFERLLETYVSFAPKGLRSFLMAMPLWLKEKLFLKKLLLDAFGEIESVGKMPDILFGEHHESHAASAFFPSPYENAAVLCLDGVGEWATSSAWMGKGNRLEPLWEMPFPHSLGLLYSRSEEHTSELRHSQISYAVFCLKKKKSKPVVVQHRFAFRLPASSAAKQNASTNSRGSLPGSFASAPVAQKMQQAFFSSHDTPDRLNQPMHLSNHTTYTTRPRTNPSEIDKTVIKNPTPPHHPYHTPIHNPTSPHHAPPTPPLPATAGPSPPEPNPAPLCRPPP